MADDPLWLYFAAFGLTFGSFICYAAFIFLHRPQGGMTSCTGRTEVPVQESEKAPSDLADAATPDRLEKGGDVVDVPDKPLEEANSKTVDLANMHCSSSAQPEVQTVQPEVQTVSEADKAKPEEDAEIGKPEAACQSVVAKPDPPPLQNFLASEPFESLPALRSKVDVVALSLTRDPTDVMPSSGRKICFCGIVGPC